MFGNDKKDKGKQAPTPPVQTRPEVVNQVAVRKSLVDRLRDRRANLITEGNDRDKEIASLDQDITWLERHPGSERVIEKFIDAPGSKLFGESTL